MKRYVPPPINLYNVNYAILIAIMVALDQLNTPTLIITRQETIK